MDASSLIEQVRCQLGVAGGSVCSEDSLAATEVCSLRQVLETRITDPRCRRGIRYRLASVLSVLIAGVACGYDSLLAIANAAAGWDQDVLAAHGVRINPVTGAYEAPSASTLTRLSARLDADELEAALSAWVAGWALDPTTPAQIARRAARAGQGPKNRGGKKRKRKPAAAAALARVTQAGHRQAAPDHPWLDPGVIVDSAYRPARVALAVDGTQRKLAKAGAKTKVHLLGALVHHLGALIGQDRVAKTEKTNEIKHVVPLLAPLPLTEVLVTADAIGDPAGPRPLAHRGHQRPLPPAGAGQPARPVRPAGRAGLDRRPDHRRNHRCGPGPHRDPHAARPAGPAQPRLPPRWPGRPHRTLRHHHEERAVGQPQLARPCPTSPT